MKTSLRRYYLSKACMEVRETAKWICAEGTQIPYLIFDFICALKKHKSVDAVTYSRQF